MSFGLGGRDESLVVLYDDMKLAFNGLISRMLISQMPEEAYTELTLRLSGFGRRLDQCMGLGSEAADARPAASHEEDRTWPPQLAHDRDNYTDTKKHTKMLLSRNKSSKSGGAGSSGSKGTGW